MSNAQQVKAQILSIEPVGSYYHLTLEAPTIAEHVLPGHFVAVAVGGIGSGMLLRRAFSIHRATKHETIEVIFAAHGQGTQWLATQQAGDVLDIVAPLGKPFALPRQAVPCVIVAGGYGSAPMDMLTRCTFWKLSTLGCCSTVWPKPVPVEYCCSSRVELIPMDDSSSTRLESRMADTRLSEKPVLRSATDKVGPEETAPVLLTTPALMERR